jgi:hypothetical protein
MRMTVLDLTQNILSAMNADEVNSIGDTVESRQVSEVIKTAYFNIITRANVPTDSHILTLDDSLLVEAPAMLRIPQEVANIDWIQYFDESLSIPSYQYVIIEPKSDFLNRVNQFDTSASNVGTWHIDQLRFNYLNDKQPQFCTVLQDKYQIIFDSHNAAFETTLHASKTRCYGSSLPSWQMSDTFIPNLDDNQFPLLLNEAKQLAFLELKQSDHPLADRESRRQWRTLQRQKHVHKPLAFDELPNFGRRARSQAPVFPNRWMRERG